GVLSICEGNQYKSLCVHLLSLLSDMSASAVPEPTASAIEKNDQAEEAEVSKPATKKRKPKVHVEGTRKSSRHQALPVNSGDTV
ncbi:hypothetical protein A2U01_0064640, partial [Trifolium medium]|nr:hypothetical protein [Trifolium medium]